MKQIILSLLILSLFAGATVASAAAFRLGGMQVFPLVDAQGESPTALLIGATKARLPSTLPAARSTVRYWPFS